MDPISMDALLSKLNAAREAASRLPASSLPAGKAGGVGPAGLPGLRESAGSAGTQPVDFAKLLAATVEQVDASQRSAATMDEQFQLGAPGVTLEDTMVALQKANISFQAAVQVRNKVVAAYNEIMSMQV